MHKSFPALFICLSLSLYSLPQQGAVVSGSAEILQKNDLMQVATSDRAILNWDSFSIGKAETLRFMQPTEQSAVLNRVLGLDVSKLDGHLLANGQVYLINPNGLIIGKDAVINTAGFVGTTLQIPDVDFLTNTDLLFQGDSTASIIHLGTIQSSQGPVTLIAHKIDNEGTITANGPVSLIAGHEILLSPPGDILHIRPDFQADGIESSGTIQTLQAAIERDGIYSFVTKHADHPSGSKIVTVGGKILLRAENAPLIVSGELTAVSGRVQLLGSTVHLKNDTVVDTSGANGGEILVGGDYRGSNPNIPNALQTIIESGAQLKADALENGNGGKIIVWSDANTFAYGPLSARAGSNGGDGGFVEVSGKYLDFQTIADRSAPKGQAGTLLLDPVNISITNAAGNTNATFTNPGYTYTGVCPAPVILSDTLLEGNLASGPVIIDTSMTNATCASAGIILVSNNVVWAAANTLTMIADQNITVDATIQNTATATGFTAINLSNRVPATTPTTGYTGVIIGSSGEVSTTGGNLVITGTGVAGTVASGGINGVSILDGGLVETLANGGLSSGNLTITGTGGADSLGNNIGISIAGSLSSFSPFCTLIGQGGGVAGGTGNNYGVALVCTTVTDTIFFHAGTGSVMATVSGTGGLGGSSNEGVHTQSRSSIQMTVNTFFSNCTGGSGPLGLNAGVHHNSSLGGELTASTDVSINFDTVTGGTSGIGGGGNNYGVWFQDGNLFGTTGSSLNFNNIQGGDSGNGTSSNHGVFISNGTLVFELPITSVGIQSGAGLNNNIGFYLTGGSVIDVLYEPLTVSIAAKSLGTGTGNSGIQFDNGSLINDPVGGVVILTGSTAFPSTSNWGIVISDASIDGTTGNISLASPASSILLENAALITTTTGNILAIADVNIVDPVSATISTTGGTITLVVDNAFPNPPGVGPGVFNIPNTVLTTTGGADLKLYGGVPNTGTFPATLNGAAYVPLLHQENAIWFPAGGYPAGDPYFIYYKTIPPAVLAKAVNDFSIAIAEAFQSWDNNWYKDYLDQDRYPPAYTPKGMNMIIPSLISFKPKIQQKLPTPLKERPSSKEKEEPLVPWL